MLRTLAVCSEVLPALGLRQVFSTNSNKAQRAAHHVISKPPRPSIAAIDRAIPKRESARTADAIEPGASLSTLRNQEGRIKGAKVLQKCR
jgi:hypothetical protein